MVLHHAARGTARSAGIDDAGNILALDAGDPRIHRLARLGRVSRNHFGPIVELEAACLTAFQVIDTDHMFDNPGGLDCAVQRLEQFLV